MTSYLVDSNVLITAKRDHYRFATFPGFWRSLTEAGDGGRLAIPDVVKDELVPTPDLLSSWVQRFPAIAVVPSKDAVTLAASAKVSAWVADPARPYTAAAVSQFFGVADYWIVARALAHGHTVVTHEKSDPLRKHRVKIPDVCVGLGVACIGPYDMLEALGVSL